MYRMKKDRFVLHFIALSVAFVFVALILSKRVVQFKPSYAYTVGACNNMSADLRSKLEVGEETLTYECFGALGDGTTNDYEAIKKTHDFANQEYIEKGIFIPVYASGDKTYYMGSNTSGIIRVATDTYFNGANFIIDDVGSGIDPTKALFRIVSPMNIDTGNYYVDYGKFTNMDCMDSNISSCTVNNDIVNSNPWKNLSITTSTTNVKTFVDSVLADTTHVDAKSMKYLKNAQLWVIAVTNSNKNYIRQGSNQNDGEYQVEDIVINSKTGEVLSDIEWNYDDVVRIRIWPVPEKHVTVENGNFTTWTNNVAFDDSGNKTTIRERNIQVFYSGNVSIRNINHYLDESKHPNNNGQQVKANGNGYNGFIRLSHASYVDLDNVYLTPHMYTKKADNSDGFATYDLIFNQSINLFFNRVSYACKDRADAQCYDDYMVNGDRWGIIGSNGSKNVFIRNSKVNRIDSHRGIRNLLVEDTTIGNKGFTLTGSGLFYGKNLIVDRSNNLISLREDYGSTWNGKMVLDNVNYVLASSSTNPTIINSNHTQVNFGYNTFFPELYLRNVTIDNDTYNSTHPVTLIHLNENATSGSNKYGFKGNIYFTKVKYKTTGSSMYLFSDDFVSNNNNLNINSYRGSSKVTIGYKNNDSNFNLVASSNNLSRLQDSSVNTKFAFDTGSTITDTIDAKIEEVVGTLSNKEGQSQMPEPLAGNFALKSAKANNKYSLNETISADRDTYTINVPVGTTSVSFTAEASGNPMSLIYPDTIQLTDEITRFDVTLFGIYATQKVYHIEINRTLALKNATIPNDAYCNSLTYAGREQTLTKNPGEGYVFTNNKGTAAGSYTVSATLAEGYQWSDGTNTTKTFNCIIQKATPTVTLNPTSVSVAVGGKATYYESASVKGKFTNTSGATGTATVTPETTLDIFANRNATATVSGVKVGTATITVTFNPTDTTNYSQVQKTLNVSVTEKPPEEKKAEIPSSGYCNELTYNGSDQTLVKAAGKGYQFSNTQGKDAGVYNVKANLESGYKWSDGSTDAKSVQCRIEKATAPITLTPSSGEVSIGSTISFKESSTVPGKFSNTPEDSKIAKASPDGTGDTPAGETVDVTVTGVAEGSTSIIVTFTPNDSTNYKSSSEQRYTVNVGSSGAGGGTVDGDEVKIPTSDEFCKDVTYNGQDQVLTIDVKEGFHFIENTKKDAGEYTIKAVVNEGFTWDDGTATDKTIECEIKKADPVITLDIPTKQIIIGQSITFNESANIQGTFSNATMITDIASISGGEKSEVQTENTPFTVTVGGSLKGSSYVKVTFSPLDALNWNTITKKFRVMVSDATILDYQDGNDKFTISNDKRYLAGNNFLYTASDVNNHTIESNITLKDNLTVEFNNGEMIIKNSETGEETTVKLANFSSDYTIEEDILYIPKAMSVDDFLNSFQKNNVTISVQKTNEDQVVAGSIVNVIYGEQIVDSYIVKIKAPDPVKTSGDDEDSDFLFGINPIFLIIGGILLVAAVCVLVIPKLKKKPKFIQQDPNQPGAPGQAVDPNQQDPNQQPPTNYGPYFQ